MTPDFVLKGNLNKFDAIVTLSSTAGFEALLEGIPVYLLGRTFYQNYPGVIRLDTYDQLNSDLKVRTCSGNFAEEVMEKYSKSCFRGSFNYMDERSLAAQNVELLISPIVEALGL